MRFSVVIAIVLFAMVPIFGFTTAILHSLGLMILPNAVGRWTYDNFEGGWWILAVIPIPFVWYWGWTQYILWNAGLL